MRLRRACGVRATSTTSSASSTTQSGTVSRTRTPLTCHTWSLRLSRCCTFMLVRTPIPASSSSCTSCQRLAFLLPGTLLCANSCHPLIQYSLTTPGIGTLIVGTGHIDDDPKKCQLGQNLIAAQIKPTGLSMSDRRAIEKTTATVQDGKTNYFQLPHQDLTPPRDVALSRDAAG